MRRLPRPPRTPLTRPMEATLTGMLAVLLMVYLLVAMLRPEKF